MTKLEGLMEAFIDAGDAHLDAKDAAKRWYADDADILAERAAWIVWGNAKATLDAALKEVNND